MVAWAQATIPPSFDESEQGLHVGFEGAMPGRDEAAGDVVMKALAAISDPYVQLQSQTKNI